MHCFPNGYKLIKSETRPKYKLFSFILDNNYFNLNYPQKYLTCLIFYESISQYKHLYDMNQKLESESKQNKFLTKKNSNIDDFNINQEDEIYIPKCLMLMSLYPFLANMKEFYFRYIIILLIKFI